MDPMHSWRALIVRLHMGTVALVALAVILTLTARLAFRASTAAGPDRDGPGLSDIAAVLRHAGISGTIGYGGMRWEAVEVVRFENEAPLTPIGGGIFGHPLYTRRGASAGLPPTLYLPVAVAGPYARVYVRYNPVP